MEINNQEKIWNEIAPEWDEYKQIPSQKAQDFLFKCSGNVLDLGSGSGRHLTRIKNGKMFLVDFSSEMLKLGAERAKSLKIPAEFIQADMTSLPFIEDYFDYGLYISALHCVVGEENRLNAVKELYRVMKKGGEVYVGVWNEKSKRFVRKTKKGEKEHLIGWTDKGNRYYYLFGEREVHDLFKSVGFKIVSSHNSEMMINFVCRK